MNGETYLSAVFAYIISLNLDKTNYSPFNRSERRKKILWKRGGGLRPKNNRQSNPVYRSDWWTDWFMSVIVKRSEVELFSLGKRKGRPKKPIYY
jgi:hypothetical protein